MPPRPPLVQLMQINDLRQQEREGQRVGVSGSMESAADERKEATLMSVRTSFCFG